SGARIPATARGATRRDVAWRGRAGGPKESCVAARAGAPATGIEARSRTRGGGGGQGRSANGGSPRRDRAACAGAGIAARQERTRSRMAGAETVAAVGGRQHRFGS